MRRILYLAFLIAPLAWSQGIRYDNPVSSINASAPVPGGFFPVLVAPGSQVIICHAPVAGKSCVSQATTYNNQAESQVCPANAQLTRPNSNVCVANADPQGNFGAWLDPGCYQWVATTSAGQQGPQDFCVGNGGAGSGITQLTGPVTAGPGSGAQTTTITPTGVTPTSYTCTNLTVNAAGQITVASDGTCGSGSSLELQHNGIDLTDQSLLNFNDTTPAAPGGNVNVTYQPDSGGDLSGYVPNVQTQIIPGFTPVATGQSVLIYPNTCGTSGSNADCVAPEGSGQVNCFGGVCESAITFSNFILPSYVLQANITSVYAVALSSKIGIADTTNFDCNYGGISGTDLVPTGAIPAMGWGQQQSDYNLGAVPTISTVTCNVTLQASGSATGTINLSGIALEVHYTGSAPPAIPGLQIMPPLWYNAALNELGATIDWVDVPNVFTVPQEISLSITGLSPAPMTIVNNVGSADLNGYDALDQSLSPGHNFWGLRVGQSTATGDLAMFGMAYAGDGSTSNAAVIQFVGDANPVAKFFRTGVLQLPELATGGGSQCLQADSSGNLSTTGAGCGSGSGGNTLTSPGGTMALGGSPTNSTVDIALGHANTWSALQTHSAGINLSGASSPMELGGSAGTSGQCLTSAGASTTPTWGTCGSGSGTVTSIATTSPITGGTITTTGTLGCASCVVSSSPGAGLAHFAGSTQTVTSSAVNLAGSDVTGILPKANGGNGTASPGITGSGGCTITGSWPTQNVSCAGSGISGLTAGYIPLAGSATTITANSHVDDGVTTGGTVTSTEPIRAPSATFTGTGIPISTGVTSNNDLAGFLTLSGGVATYSFTSTHLTSPVCVANDNTSVAAVKVVTTTTTLTVTGTGADSVSYICIGRT